MKNQTLIILTVMYLCGIAGLQQAQAEAVQYTLDNDHTHIVWQVDRFGFASTVGTFTDIQGALIFDEQTPGNSSVTATIALAGLRSDLQQREEIVRSRFWLDADKFPQITFRSSQVEPASEAGCDVSCLTVTGEMTLKGVTRPLELQVRLNKLGDDPVTGAAAAGFTATGAFARSDFGINLALGPIGDEVSFSIQALAIVDSIKP